MVRDLIRSHLLYILTNDDLDPDLDLDPDPDPDQDLDPGLVSGCGESS